MRWKKLGKIFEPDGKSEWMHTHATIPFADHLEGSLYKIYFSPRDSRNRSHVAWVIIDMNDPLKVLECAEEPVLIPGDLGTFDDSGAIGNVIVNVGVKKYLYYTGCNLGVTVLFRNNSGLAISEDGGETFERFSAGPVLDRTYKEPHFSATPHVLFEDGLFKVWYVSCVRWVLEHEGPKHYYHIKYAESDNGIDWQREGIVAIDFKNTNEYAIGVPRVIHENGFYKMWYCFRGESYRIGYAESLDGKSWERKDELMDFAVSESGWDSEMLAYPYIFDYDNTRYMLYNGNRYGRTGFGIAQLLSS